MNASGDTRHFFIKPEIRTILAWSIQQSANIKSDWLNYSATKILMNMSVVCSKTCNLIFIIIIEHLITDWQMCDDGYLSFIQKAECVALSLVFQLVNAHNRCKVFFHSPLPYFLNISILRSTSLSNFCATPYDISMALVRSSFSSSHWSRIGAGGGVSTAPTVLPSGA